MIFAIDSGAVKVNCPFSKKIPVTVKENKLQLYLYINNNFEKAEYCLITVKLSADAELLKNKLEEYFD